MSAVPCGEGSLTVATTGCRNQWDLNRFSRFGIFPHMPQGLRLRRVHLALPNFREAKAMLPSPCQDKVGTRKRDFRSSNTWPAALPPVRNAQHDVVTAVAPPPGSRKSMLLPFFRKKTFHSLIQNRFYPGTPDSFFLPFVCFPKSASRLSQFGLQLSQSEIAGLTNEKSSLLTLIRRSELARIAWLQDRRCLCSNRMDGSEITHRESACQLPIAAPKFLPSHALA